MSQASVLIDRMAVVGRRISGTPEWPLEAAAFLGVLAMIEVALRADESSVDISMAMLLGLCATVPLAFVRPQVLAAAAMITLATFLTVGALLPVTAAGLVALLAALYLLGRHRARWVSALVLFPFVAYAVIGPPDGDADGRLFPVILAFATAIAAGLGSALRARREAVEREASRHTLADTLLEHAALGERARIARELHDVVAHHISMIAVQAETARLTTLGLPDDGAKRLLAIGDTARTALTEMRRLLGVLRDDAGTETSRQPTPGLQQLIELIDEARDAASVSTRLIIHGQVVPLDPGVELTAYRIVQEALTNARRHAPGAAVDVELDYAGDVVHLRVRDNGPGTSGGSSVEGHGLLGMRERALAVGGDLWAGPGPVSGFLVEARLPVAALATATAAE